MTNATAMNTCPATIRPTDRYEQYSTPRPCGRPAKHGAFCGIHNPDRPVNPWFLAKRVRRAVLASLDAFARGIGEAR